VKPEDSASAVVRSRVREETALQLLVVMLYKCLTNPITNQKPCLVTNS
jgi:hypothetical protein